MYAPMRRVSAVTTLKNALSTRESRCSSAILIRGTKCGKRRADQLGPRFLGFQDDLDDGPG